MGITIEMANNGTNFERLEAEHCMRILENPETSEETRIAANAWLRAYRKKKSTLAGTKRKEPDERRGRRRKSRKNRKTRSRR
jgi:hypothetical protein